MGIFSRLGDIINSNINSLLDRAENPEKMLKNIIQEMEDTLVELRTSAAKTIATKKQLERRLDAAKQQQADWQEKAELAVSKQRDDLAKAALIEKAKLSDSLISLNEQLGYVQEDIDKYNEDISGLQQKLNDARHRHQQLNSRINANKQQLKAREKVSDDKMHKITSQLDQFEQKMDFMEARVESHKLGQQKNLHQELADLAVEDSIQNELDALKKHIETKSKGE